jgi:hypothetical protein
MYMSEPLPKQGWHKRKVSERILAKQPDYYLKLEAGCLTYLAESRKDKNRDSESTEIPDLQKGTTLNLAGAIIKTPKRPNGTVKDVTRSFKFTCSAKEHFHFKSYTYENGEEWRKSLKDHTQYANALRRSVESPFFSPLKPSPRQRKVINLNSVYTQSTNEYSIDSARIEKLSQKGDEVFSESGIEFEKKQKCNGEYGSLPQREEQETERGDDVSVVSMYDSKPENQQTEYQPGVWPSSRDDDAHSLASLKMKVASPKLEQASEVQSEVQSEVSSVKQGEIHMSATASMFVPPLKMAEVKSAASSRGVTSRSSNHSANPVCMRQCTIPYRVIAGNKDSGAILNVCDDKDPSLASKREITVRDGDILNVYSRREVDGSTWVKCSQYGWVHAQGRILGSSVKHSSERTDQRLKPVVLKRKLHHVKILATRFEEVRVPVASSKSSFCFPRMFGLTRPKHVTELRTTFLIELMYGNSSCLRILRDVGEIMALRDYMMESIHPAMENLQMAKCPDVLDSPREILEDINASSMVEEMETYLHTLGTHVNLATCKEQAFVNFWLPNSRDVKNMEVELSASKGFRGGWELEINESNHV